MGALAEYNLQKSEDDGNILSVEYKRDRCPGDLGFDPLNALKGSGSNKKYLHNIEVNLGRLAMVGVTSFLLQEFALKLRWPSFAAGGQGSSDASPSSREGQ